MYCDINPLVTIPNLHLVLAPHLVSTTYKDKATTNTLWELHPNCLQKEGPKAKSLSKTALP